MVAIWTGLFLGLTIEQVKKYAKPENNHEKMMNCRDDFLKKK